MTKLRDIKLSNYGCHISRRVLLDCAQEAERFLARQFQIMADAGNIDSYEAARQRAIEVVAALSLTLGMHSHAFEHVRSEQPGA